MTLLVVAGAQLAYGMQPLLDDAFLSVQSGERIGLIGRNGTGKSSLLALITGTATLDDGEIRRQDGLRTVLVEQEPALPVAHTIRESLLERGAIATIPDERERWRVEARLVEQLHRFGLDETTDPAAASGGERKRAALALALALQPDLLLLDEPTNHLDIDGIALLEAGLLKAVRTGSASGPSAIVVTHDRAFLDRVATRIVELDRGLLRGYPGNYTDFERAKASEIAAEDAASRRFDKYWAEEETWIRKGVEARRTRNQGRVRRLASLREARSARRERLGNVKLAIDAGARSGKLVAELAGVTKAFDGRPIVRNLDLLVSRGDRIGLIGRNGAGKSTLLRLILGTLEPDAGRIRFGTHIEVAYFDQLREVLDPERTVADTIVPGGEWVEVNGTRKHIMSYLGDFLFPPRRAHAKVRMLSGGERNRLLLARLFARPANVLVLDEPTNDLDIESLELLESALQDYPGTLLLVSHDRVFLDNVVTQTVVAEGDGVWREYVGGYSDWLAQRPADATPVDPPPRAAGPTAAGRPATAPKPQSRPAAAKLSFREARVLEALPAEIEALEAEQQSLAARMATADYFRQAPDVLRADQARAGAIESLLQQKFEQWETLEARARAAGAATGPPAR